MAKILTGGAVALEVQVLEAGPGAEQAREHLLRRALVAHHEQALPVERLAAAQAAGGTHAHAAGAAQLRIVAALCATASIK